MAEILDFMQTTVQRVIMALGYPGITLVMLVENLFPPIPSEIVMPFAGFLVSEEELTFIGIMIAGTIGAGLGALAIYYFGYWIGQDRLRILIRSYGHYVLLSERDLDNSLSIFERYGVLAVLLGRLVPTVRSLISLPAGLARMPIALFLVLTLVGTAAWNFLLATAGVFLGRHWDRVLELVSTYEKIIWAGLAGLVLAFIIQRLKNRRVKV